MSNIQENLKRPFILADQDYEKYNNQVNKWVKLNEEKDLTEFQGKQNSQDKKTSSENFIPLQLIIKRKVISIE